MLFGVIAIIFGILVFIYPGETVVIFLWIFGIFLLAGGIVLIAYSFRRSGTHRWLTLIEGILAIIIGIIALAYPGMTALTVVYLVGFFALFSGIIQIIEAFFVPRGEKTGGMSSRWFLAGSGIWSLLIGVLLLAVPLGGILAAVWIVAAYAIVLGIMNILTGFRMRSASKPGVPTQ